jgi:hypothetical protein
MHFFKFSIDPVFHKVLPALATAKIIALHSTSIFCSRIKELHSTSLGAAGYASLVSCQMTFVTVHGLILLLVQKSVS